MVLQYLGENPEVVIHAKGMYLLKALILNVFHAQMQFVLCRSSEPEACVFRPIWLQVQTVNHTNPYYNRGRIVVQFFQETSTYSWIYCKQVPHKSLTHLDLPVEEWKRGTVVYLYGNSAAPEGRYRMVRRAKDGPRFWVFESELHPEDLPEENYAKVISSTLEMYAPFRLQACAGL